MAANKDFQAALMDIFESLKRDHKEISDLLIKLQGTSKRAHKARRRLFEQLSKEIELHTRLESTYFYSVLDQWEELREPANQAITQHVIIKQFLLELDSLEMSDRQWDDTLTQLAGDLRDHMQNEEEMLFRHARKKIDDAMAKELGRLILEEKKEFLIEM